MKSLQGEPDFKRLSAAGERREVVTRSITEWSAGVAKTMTSFQLAQYDGKRRTLRQRI